MPMTTTRDATSATYEERAMAIVSNPFVDYLSRYTTASPDHEAAFD
jgi:hypothetical protein